MYGLSFQKKANNSYFLSFKWCFLHPAQAITILQVIMITPKKRAQQGVRSWLLHLWVITVKSFVFTVNNTSAPVWHNMQHPYQHPIDHKRHQSWMLSSILCDRKNKSES